MKTILKVSRIQKAMLFLLPALIIFSSFFSAQTAFSQSVFGGSLSGYAPSISIAADPAYPAPLQTVTLTVSSTGVDVQSVPISWYVNGTLQSQGSGESTFTITTGAAGSKSTVEAIANDPVYGAIKASVILTPGDVDILWEARTYTPPFYRGKALPTSQAQIKLVAIPHDGNNTSPSNFTYDWFLDYQRQQNISGYGKRSPVVQGDYKNHTDTVTVHANNTSGSSVAGTAKISFVAPQIVFYPDIPSSGIDYKEALTNNITWKGTTLKIVAEPYFFQFDDRDSNNGKYEWTVNGNETPPNGGKSVINVRFPSTSHGSASISLSISIPSRLLPGTSEGIMLHF